MRKISVIVPVYNAERTLEACLTTLFALAHPDYEVIVVDDASTDRSLDVAAAFPCRLVRLERNAGAAEARNRGARQARGEILAFTDADCLVPPDWLVRVERALSGGAAAVTGVYSEPQDASPLARFVGHDIRLRFLRLAALANVFGTYNGAVLRHVFDAVGGFDGGIPGASWEDVEFGLRVVESGYRLVIDKDNAVCHQHPQTARVYARKQASKACGQFLLRSRGRHSDYLDRSVALQVLLTAALPVTGFLTLWLGWPGGLGALVALTATSLLNRQLLGRIRAREGWRGLVRGVGYVLLRNVAWVVGILGAIGLTFGAILKRRRDSVSAERAPVGEQVGR